MIRNYFRTAFRNIQKQKWFTLIKVLGLALGICACIVIYLVTSYDLSFDKFHPDKERIYRIGCKEKGFDFINSEIPAAAPAAFRAEVPGLETVTRSFLLWSKVSVKTTDGNIQTFNSDKDGVGGTAVIVTGPEYFSVFKREWIAGNPTGSMEKPFTVVLTESRARKYFGNLPVEKIIGREVIYSDSLRLTVSGIVRDWKEKSDFAFTDFISFNTIENSFLKDKWYRMHINSWDPPPINQWVESFIKLEKGTKISDVNLRLQSLVKKYMQVRPDDFQMTIEPLEDIHFNTDYSHEDIRKAHLPTLYSLMGVALFILLLAAINFINLSTAQSIQRSKEIGIRKVLGSSRAALVGQFLTETFVITLLSACVAGLLVNPALFFFQDFIPTGITFHLTNTGVLIFIFIITVFTSLLAGLYPAKVLSSYQPIISLKGQPLQKGNEKWLLRKGLIVFQFIISLVFIITTVTVVKQIRYMLNSDFGFKTDAIVTFYTDWRSDHNKIHILEQKIKSLSGIKELVLQGNPPARWGRTTKGISYQGKKNIKVDVTVDLGGEKYIPFYNIKILAGRNIRHTDSLAELVVNETCTRALGFANPADVIGQFVTMDDRLVPVVGVVADFHESSFHDAIGPVIIGRDPNQEMGFGIKLAAKTNAHQTFAAIEKIWKEIYPKNDFEYLFLDESIALYYEAEQKTSKLLSASMIITIFICCMGLFGLAMFSAERRTKEIGIRKVLGASAFNIASMLSADFAILICIALLIASPIAWYFSNRWLQDFVYRVEISWWIFAIAGISVILIALITVSFHALRAALANPVKSLRTE